MLVPLMAAAVDRHRGLAPYRPGPRLSCPEARKPLPPSSTPSAGEENQMTARSIVVCRRSASSQAAQPSKPGANYVPFTRSGNRLFPTGQLSPWNDERRFRCFPADQRRGSAPAGPDSAPQSQRSICARGLDGDSIGGCRLRLAGCVNSWPAFTAPSKMMGLPRRRISRRDLRQGRPGAGLHRRRGAARRSRPSGPGRMKRGQGSASRSCWRPPGCEKCRFRVRRRLEMI
jgi:hypothetical protein